MEGTQGEKCNDHIRSLRSSMEHGACASKVGSLHQPRWKRSGTLAGWSVNAAELGQVTFRKRLLRVTTKYHNKDTCKITQAFLPLESDTIRALFLRQVLMTIPHTKREGIFSIVALCGNVLSLLHPRPMNHMNPCTHLYTLCAPQRVLQLGRGWQALVLGGFEGPSEPGAWPSKDGQRIYIYIWTSWSCKKVSRKFQEQWRADLFHTNC